uniref:Uncharacterized protein n=1 Tax=Palpitomonas bilix TaxID=652834 RepID=A0A7S3GG81_9EUKA|mmetsp:Transcript_47881/g.124288  ORF Transcript_47881/g.124288 Transcript_47881/m.124288 type:complete len:512 (+) Transcript_47881:93-1628(+)|eukprot:CAMPEP_0113882272 /NCGR_PEP_ID=MMETSP0780_2-20120614/8857_1 /TAXON_ID=652834 /ORGANISM="Palpitomonas bilix" /LENGTH=511 /DNA_ID=CAMNT_0000869257 /DNA_START=107 /DNA_END=1642 /DNA_ORIENTATION=+ /assembly_acc=CAM_ASM_000599
MSDSPNASFSEVLARDLSSLLGGQTFALSTSISFAINIAAIIAIATVGDRRVRRQVTTAKGQKRKTTLGIAVEEVELTEHGDSSNRNQREKGSFMSITPSGLTQDRVRTISKQGESLDSGSSLPSPVQREMGDEEREALRFLSEADADFSPLWLRVCARTLALWPTWDMRAGRRALAFAHMFFVFALPSSLLVNQVVIASYAIVAETLPTLRDLFIYIIPFAAIAFLHYFWRSSNKVFFKAQRMATAIGYTDTYFRFANITCCLFFFLSIAAGAGIAGNGVYTAIIVNQTQAETANGLTSSLVSAVAFFPMVLGTLVFGSVFAFGVLLIRADMVKFKEEVSSRPISTQQCLDCVDRFSSLISSLSSQWQPGMAVVIGSTTILTVITLILILQSGDALAFIVIAVLDVVLLMGLIVMIVPVSKGTTEALDMPSFFISIANKKRDVEGAGTDVDASLGRLTRIAKYTETTLPSFSVYGIPLSVGFLRSTLLTLMLAIMSFIAKIQNGESVLPV